MQKKQQTFGSRFGMFIFGLGILVFLGLFTIPAFWDHMLQLNPTYIKMAQAGACAGEFGLLGYLLWHSFSKSLEVRQMSLIFGAILALVILVHSAALWGLKDGQSRQTAKEAVLQSGLKDLSTSQMKEANGKFKSKSQREIALNAQKEFTEKVENRDKAIHSATFLPDWYLNGPMYLAIFLTLMLTHCFLAYKHFTVSEDKIDRDHDGVPDYLQEWWNRPDVQAQQKEARGIYARAQGATPEMIEKAERYRSPSLSDAPIYDESKRVATQRPKANFDVTKTPTRVATQRDGERALRDHLQVIFSHYPNWNYRVDVKPHTVFIRMIESRKGIEKTKNSSRHELAILEHALRPGFRNRLIDKLIKAGFPLDAEKGRE